MSSKARFALFLLVFPLVSVLGVKLPDVVEVTSNLNSADDAIAEMWVSHDYTPTDRRRVHAGVTDLCSVELKALNDFIDANAAKPNTVKIVLIRYEIGDPRIIDVLI